MIDSGSSTGATLLVVVDCTGKGHLAFASARRTLCLDQLSVDCRVADDASDDCRRTLEAVWSQIVYLPTGSNLGFSGGVNVGIRAALERGADVVMLVNSDVVIAPDCVEHLEQSLARAPHAGIAGPVVLARSSQDRLPRSAFHTSRSAVACGTV